MKLLIFSLTITLVGCSTDNPKLAAASNQTVDKIYWSDGDSGRLDGVPFRLKDVDAPETSGVGTANGAARCERERELGFLAKEFIVTLTANAVIVVTQHYGADRYNRDVVDLSTDGIDVASAGIAAGHLSPWPHDSNGSALAAKPDWCQ